MENTYWTGNGKYQEDYTRLFADLVPDMDSANTRHGELLRCVSNIYYDFYNNGGCNLAFSLKSDVETLVRWRGADVDNAKSALSTLRRALNECSDTTPSSSSYDEDDDEDSCDYWDDPFDGLADNDTFLNGLETLVDEIVVWVRVRNQCN